MKTMNRPMLRRLQACAVGLGLAAFGPAVLAEDIDIYAGKAGSADRPNVLLILDNSANWSSSIPAPNCYYKENGVLSTVGPKATNPGKEQGTKMAIEKCALYNLIDGLPVNTDPAAGVDDALFNVGIMLLNESPNNGAYPRKALTPLTSTNKAAMKALIKGLTIGGDKGSNADFAKAMYEAYLYFKGSAPYQGTLGSKWDSAAVTAGKYNSTTLASCARNYVIFIANGAPQSSENGSALALLGAAGGNTSQVTYPTSYVKSTDQANWADEFARFMRNADVSTKEDAQGIITHGVAVTGASSDGLYPNFIESMSKPYGGTFTKASDAEALLTGLLAIFNEIQAVNSVFAAPTLPVSVNARGTYENQIFIGMFRPDAKSKPRWVGNVKQFRMGRSSLGLLQLVDANGDSAVSATTGFLSPTATSFWTTASTFWADNPMGTPPTGSDGPDGDVVEKGAVAQRLRTTFASSQTARKVYTCIACAGGSVLGLAPITQFNTANALITNTALGVALTERDKLINWVRGTNNGIDEPGPSASPSTTIRPSVHGDVLHSRPSVVNYGGTTGVVVFYGANDGMLHAVNGNQTGTGAGEELWAFVPPESFSKLERLRSNSPPVKLSTTVAPAARARDYFMDGPIGTYQKLNADKTVNKVIIYVGMRRGGRQLYAFDVTSPSSPKFLWKVTPSDLPNLGQTWSEARIARIRGNTDPVLVFGGGYDADAEDTSTAGTTTMGNRVYVLDAFTGVELKSFTTDRSVPSDVSLVDSDYDGYVDRAYAADLGGKIYRIDFETSAGNTPADWTSYTFADMTGGTSTGRKFFYGPEALVTRDFVALNLGSGDREKPLMTGNQDHFLQLFDRRKDKGAPASPSAVTFSALSPVSSTSSVSGPGCYVTLEASEKVVNGAASISGNTYFGTNRPGSTLAPTAICRADLGLAKSYSMPLFCTTPTSSVLTGGGLPPSPVAGIVRYTKPDSSTELIPFCIGCPNDKGSGIEASDKTVASKVPRKRMYWYQESKR